MRTRPTVQDVIDNILTAVPGAPREETVDTLKSGAGTEEVTGIVSTFLASYRVIQRAVELGANFIITHEPTYYNHLDEVEELAQDPVYEAKRALIEKHGIVIWRFHDYWHMHRPDGILTGMAKDLGWEDWAEGENSSVFTIPSVSLRDLALFLKERLDIGALRVVGDLEVACQRVGLMLGAAGGGPQIKFLRKADLDVIVCGEVHEWEIVEYVRDGNDQGRKMGLIMLGHAVSEEPGMAWLVEWLRPRFPEVSVTHVPVGDPFHFV